MIEIKGKYNEAKIFTDVVDSASIAQVQELCNQEFTAGSRIRLMPDIHAGAGCTIGTTMTITDKVVPNLVGVDIGCGMETTRIREGRLELQKLDKLIYEKIPSGFSIRDKAHRYLNEIDLSELCCARHVDLLRAEKSIGTLGGGNHFIEVDKDDEGNLYIVVHSGSRHLGVEVASYYQEAGYKVLNRTDDASIEALIARMKAEGREKKIQKELKKLKNLKQTNIPKALAYVSGELFEQYIHDMKIVQHFAMLNRQAMMDEIVKGMKLHVVIAGDFGGLWDGSQKDQYWLDWLNKKPFTTLFVDGNHENFDLLNTLPEKEWNGGRVHVVREHVLHLMRGQVFDFGGLAWFTMGGAASHDIQDGILDPAAPDFERQYWLMRRMRSMFRVKGVSWWEEEMPSLEEYQEALANLERVNWTVDCVLTHCAPSGVVQEINPSYGTDELTDFLEMVSQRCKFAYWFFGHYHENRIIDQKYILQWEKISELGF